MSVKTAVTHTPGAGDPESLNAFTPDVGEVVERVNGTVNINGIPVTIGGDNGSVVVAPDGTIDITGAPVTIGDGAVSDYVQVDADGVMMFVGAAGMIFGSFYGNELDWENGGPTAGVFTVISDADTVVGELSGVTFQNDQELLIATAGKYIVTYSLALTVAGAGKHVESAIGLEGVALEPGRTHVNPQNANVTHALAGVAVLDLAAAEKVSVMVTNETDTSVITVEHVNLAVVQIGG